MTRADSPPPSTPASLPSQSAAPASATPAPSATAPAHASTQTSQRPPRLALFIATGFGLGYLPKAPGTWGSLGGTLLFFLIAFPDWAYRLWLTPSVDDRLFILAAEIGRLQPSSLYALVFVVALLGLWSANRVSRHLQVPDPQCVVIDEVSGQLIALFFGGAWVPTYPEGWSSFGASPSFWQYINWQYLLAGFILFRVFDIWKPWSVRAAERLPGGWGIMADDWVAGVYAALGLWALRALGM